MVFDLRTNLVALSIVKAAVKQAVADLLRSIEGSRFLQPGNRDLGYTVVNTNSLLAYSVISSRSLISLTTLIYIQNRHALLKNKGMGQCKAQFWMNY